MEKITAILCEYKKGEYYSLLQIVDGIDCIELQISLLTPDTDGQLQAVHIFRYQEVRLLSDRASKAKKSTKLRLQIAHAVEEYKLTNPLNTN